MTEPSVPTEGRNAEPKIEKQRTVDALWAEGGDGALARLQRLIDADSASLRIGSLPSGSSIRVWPSERDYQQAVELVEQEPWNHGTSHDRLALGVRNALAWVGIRQRGRLVATAHAVGDASTAWMQDVCVEPAQRGLGYGRALVGLLLRHPAIRHADVCLSTSTAEGFYSSLGFVTALSATRRAPALMILRRPASS